MGWLGISMTGLYVAQNTTVNIWTQYLYSAIELLDSLNKYECEIVLLLVENKNRATSLMLVGKYEIQKITKPRTSKLLISFWFFFRKGKKEKNQILKASVDAYLKSEFQQECCCQFNRLSGQLLWKFQKFEHILRK